jgi:hypothetical protein
MIHRDTPSTCGGVIHYIQPLWIGKLFSSNNLSAAEGRPSEVFLNEFSIRRGDHKRLALHDGSAHDFLWSAFTMRGCTVCTARS